MIVQAALFASFLSAFLIELLGRLEQDPMDIIQDVLIYQTQMMRNSSLGPYVPAEFSPPGHIVVVNALFYASLSCIILAAFIAMVIKTWVREFDRGLRAMSLPEQRAKTREFRYLGIERWRLPEMVGILPLLIHVSLFLFAVGLLLLLFYISKPSFCVTTAFAVVGALFYATTTSISVFVASSPFHSPLTRTLGKVYRHLHAYLCPPVHFFLSEHMDTAPAAALDRVRRHAQVILQKWRPYLEKGFEEPIAATTVDEVQIYMAASALKRIHESAPNSQHSEALQCSVWQVAGSPALRVPPLFSLPSWILDRTNDEEYFSDLPPAIVVAFVAVALRARHNEASRRIATARAVLQRVGNPNVPWVRLVILVCDRLSGRKFWNPEYSKHMRRTEYNLTSMIQRKELQRDESLWLLSTLSEFCSEERPSGNAPFFIGICLTILLDHAPKWSYENPPDIILLEAIVTLAAISCSPNRADRLNILTGSRKHPWLLLNIRNPNLVMMLFEGTPSDYHKQLVALLFLVVYALIYRDSYPLAVQYFTFIMAKGDLPLYTSALTAIAPAITVAGLSTIGRLLVAPQTQDLTPIISDSMHHESPVLIRGLLEDYDCQLGDSENPDPDLFAIILVLSRHLYLWERWSMRSLELDLKNPWLSLVARVLTLLDNPTGPGMPMGSYHDHRVHNMIAALSLLPFTRPQATRLAPPFLLTSFLESREVCISSATLEYYLKIIISNSDTSAPPSSLSTAVAAAFNFMSPDYPLWTGWRILDTFVNGFETLSIEWRQTFAEGFFTSSRQRLPRLRGDIESSTTESELNKILTWEYFHEEEREPELTDSTFSGLDWMAMAWSLHLSRQYGGKIVASVQGNAQSQNLSGPAVHEEFVLRALCRLLDAAPYYRIIPIISKIREFVQWFDETELPEYRSAISDHIEEALRRYGISHELQSRSQCSPRI